MPPPLKEILDSEDEDELLPVQSGFLPAAIATTTATSGEDAPLVESEMDADQSSASTAEQLRRAHLDLMASTQHATPAADSAPRAVNGHKRSMTEAAPRSSGKLKRIKVVTAPQELRQPLTGSTVPGATIPESVPLGTSDTVPGDTYPGGQDAVKRTPKSRARRSSQQQSSSGEQQNSLTPWSVSAIGSSDRLNSDDAAVGLPKEMYNPRPSRSRSAQVDTSHYDFSEHPDKTAKKARRVKTDTQIPTSEPLFPANPILQAPDTERLTPSPADTEVTATEDTIQVKAAPDVAPKKVTKGKQPAKRRRPQKQAVIEEEDEQDELASDSEITVAPAVVPAPTKYISSTPRKSKTEVQVMISPSKPKADKDILQNILAGLGHTNSAEPSPQPEPKSRAKRKTADKNVQEAKLSEEKAEVVAEATEPIIAESKEDSRSESAFVLQPEPEAEVDAEAPIETPRANRTLSDVEKSAESTSITQTVKKGTSSSTKPSWQQTSYRVGLSKTQRIPSLLKVFKK